MAAARVSARYGSDNPENMRQRLMLIAGFGALRSLQENVVRYPLVRDHIGRMLDTHDVTQSAGRGGTGGEAGSTPDDGGASRRRAAWTGEGNPWVGGAEQMIMQLALVPLVQHHHDISVNTTSLSL